MSGRTRWALLGWALLVTGLASAAAPDVDQPPPGPFAAAPPAADDRARLGLRGAVSSELEERGESRLISGVWTLTHRRTVHFRLFTPDGALKEEHFYDPDTGAYRGKVVNNYDGKSRLFETTRYDAGDRATEFTRVDYTGAPQKIVRNFERPPGTAAGQEEVAYDNLGGACTPSPAMPRCVCWSATR